jgi:hypothetical protein
MARPDRRARPLPLFQEGLILNPDPIRAALFPEPTTPFCVSLRARPYGVDIDRRSWLGGPKHHKTVTGHDRTLAAAEIPETNVSSTPDSRASPLHGEISARAWAGNIRTDGPLEPALEPTR